MLYYNSDAQGLTSNGTPLTESDHMQLKTATTRSANIIGIQASGRSATPGGNTIRARRFSTASTSGSALTPAPLDAGAQAAVTGVVTGPTAGTTATQLLSFGFPATGGNGWQAMDLNTGIYLDANGGAKGNVDIFSICTAASVPIDLAVTHGE